jgi:nucleotide-binding universal stress UspA family protein
MMTFRNILVHVDNTKAGKTRVAAAVALASRLDCALTGVFLKSENYPNYVIADAILPPAGDVLELAIEERTEEVCKASAAARAMFDEVVRDAFIPFHWVDVNGDNEAQLIACARRHDLAILPPEMKPAFGARTIKAAQIGMASGGPVLVLKHGGYPIAFGKKILVAWNDSRESARALRDAWPFLATAEEITFLTVSHRAENELDELMQRHLHSHDCKHGRLVVDRGDPESIGDLIKLQVAETGADMVVLGLYGHSRLYELVLGGVSKDLLQDPPMPMLISH